MRMLGKAMGEALSCSSRRDRGQKSGGPPHRTSDLFCL